MRAAAQLDLTRAEIRIGDFSTNHILKGILAMTVELAPRAPTIDLFADTGFSDDRLSGASRAHVIDRWIFVFTAATFVAVVLVAFIPDSITKLALVRAGQRPPFPLILHIHA